MQRNPSLPIRRSVRLPLFDYSQPSAYFITICSRDKKCIFGRVNTRDMLLNALGRIANDCWLEIPRHFATIELAPHVVMPNHIHGIIIIRTPAVDGDGVAKHPRRARHAVPLRPERPMREFALPTIGSIPTIVGAFKSAVSKRINAAHPAVKSSIWQRGYYERIIRDQKEFGQTCEYIRLNPAQWDTDDENPGRTVS